MTSNSNSPETLCAQAMGWIDETTKAIVQPVHVSTTYLRDEDNEYRSGRSYVREDNPSWDQAEALITRLENGAATLLFSAGMAAATAPFLALRPGDHVVIPEVMYWAFRKWLFGSADRVGHQGRSGRHDRPRARAGRDAAGQDQDHLGGDAVQPDVAGVRPEGAGGDCARRGRAARRGFHLRHADPDAADRAGRGSRDACRDQVPERPFRRAGRIADHRAAG